MLRKFSSHFLAGLLAILPLVITVVVVGFIYSKLVAWFGPASAFGQLVHSIARVTEIPPAVTYVATFVLVVVLISSIGATATRLTGQRVRDFFNGIIGRIPFLNKVYSSVEQVVQLFDQKGGDDAASALSDVVMARIANTYTLGMLANSEPVDIDGVPHYFFYMPNTPVPATGNLYLVPENDIYNVDVSVEEMTRIEMSLGSLGPGIVNSRTQPEAKKIGQGSKEVSA